MIDMHLLRVVTALKTPYNRAGSIDMAAWRDLLEYQISEGVRGFVVGGTTGEGHMMLWTDQIHLIEKTVEQVGSRGIVIGNTGSNNTREAMLATRDGFSAGMQLALQINPYYSRTSTAGLRAHFDHLLGLGPTILYNVPSRTGQDIPDALVREFSAHPHFVGIKECCGVERIRVHTAAGIRTWSGNDVDFRDAVANAGAFGVISVASNIVPRQVTLILAAPGQDTAAFDALLTWMGKEPNPIGVNTALAMLGACEPVFRLPYLPFVSADRETGIAVLRGVADARMHRLGIRSLDDAEFCLLA